MTNVILCRGNSVSKFLDLEFSSNCVFSLVNEWDNLLNGGKFAQKLIAKDIYHYINREKTARMHSMYYGLYDVRKVFLNVYKDEYIVSENKKYLDSIGVHHSYPMPDELKRYALNAEGGFPSLGVQTVAHSSLLNFEEYHIFGMDFFEDQYFSHHSHCDTKEPKTHQKKKGVIMKSFLGNFLSKFPDKTYHFYTNSTFNPPLSNVIIHN